MTRGQAIAAKCRECMHDPAAVGTWREQVATCHCVDCPLWGYRPLPRSAPPWIASRNVGNLPDGFADLHHDDAIRQVRANIAAKVANDTLLHASQTPQGGAASGVAVGGDAAALCSLRVL